MLTGRAVCPREVPGATHGAIPPSRSRRIERLAFGYTGTSIPSGPGAGAAFGGARERPRRSRIARRSAPDPDVTRIPNGDTGSTDREASVLRAPRTASLTDSSYQRTRSPTPREWPLFECEERPASGVRPPSRSGGGVGRCLLGGHQPRPSTEMAGEHPTPGAARAEVRAELTRPASEGRPSAPERARSGRRGTPSCA